METIGVSTGRPSGQGPWKALSTGSYQGITVPINAFDFTVSRHRDGPEIFLDTFMGKLMADCYLN